MPQEVTVLRPAQEFFSYIYIKDVTIAGERLQNLDLCSTKGLRPFGSGTPLMPYFLYAPFQLPLATRKGMVGTYSNSDPHGVMDSRNNNLPAFTVQHWWL
jgi:hypothetical protein